MDFLKNSCFTELDNGFGIYFLHRPGPAVEMQIYVATGSIHEGEFLGCGLSHFLEHMLFQGCRNYPCHGIADTVTALGGDLNATTWCDRTCYRMTLPREHWAKGIDMLSSMVRYPELPEERFIQERDVILRECERSRDNISNRMYDLFLRTMFTRHPLRHPIIGYREMISQVTRDMAWKYYENRYAPNRAFAVVVGNCRWEDVKEQFSLKMGDWQRKNLAETALPRETVPAGGRSAELVFEDALSRAMWGVQLPEFGDPELPAADVLFGILGTGESSMLNTELVIGSRLALNGRSFCFALADQAVAGVSMETEPGKLHAAESELKRMLERCAKGKFSAARMEREKGQQYADHLRGLRSILSVAGEIAEGVIHAGDPGAGDRFLEQLQKVDYEQLKNTAANFLGSDRWIKVRQLAKARKEKSVALNSTPEIHSKTLNSGCRMLCSPEHSLPLCCFSLLLPGGSIYEAPGQGGISQLCASMMSAKMENMSENAILKRLDELCIDIDISSGSNSLMLDLSVPKRKFPAAVEFIGKLLSRAEFPEDIFERERSYLLSRLQVRKENPVRTAFDHAQKMLYGSHPYANGTAGNFEDLEALDAASVESFYRKLWNPERAAVAFGGDCSLAEAEKLAAMLDGMFNWNRDEKLEMPEAPVFPGACCRESILLPREQTVVLRSVPGVSLADIQAVTALDILGNMENGLGSNLFKEVREKNALSYSVGMTYTCGFHPGLISFYAMTAPGAEEKVLELLEAEMKRLASGIFSDEEFEAARRGAAFDAEMCLSKPESLLRTALLDNYYGLDVNAVLEKSKMLQNFSRTEFASTLQRLLSAGNGCAVTVLPAGTVKTE